MLDPEDSALLVDLIAAAETPQPEIAVLSVLSRRFQADGARIYRAGLCWSLGTNPPTQQPLPDVMTGLRLNRIYTAEELSQADMGDLRALGLALQDVGIVWLVLTRDKTPFRAIDSARLAAYAPHLKQSFDLSIHFAGLQAQQQLHALVARRIGVGVVQRDTNNGLFRPDAIARDLLIHADVSLSAIAQRWSQGGQASGDVISLAQQLDMLILPVQPNMRSSQIALLRNTDMPLPPDPQIAAALGITVAEARLARTLARGASLNDAALSLGLTVQTARFYSKQIFAKTGLSGQPALIRRIWTSALALSR
jgi:DNA-binding CsgD family transcriptional regulator